MRRLRFIGAVRACLSYSMVVIFEVSSKRPGSRPTCAARANVIICTGTHATVPPIPGLAEVQPLTHIETLELDRVPEHLLVLGGGYVGAVLSQAMRRFGINVTILDTNDRCHGKTRMYALLFAAYLKTKALKSF